MADNNLQSKSLEKPKITSGWENKNFEIGKKRIEQEKKSENIPQPIDKILPGEKQEDIPANGLVQASNQQYFEKEEQKKIEKILAAGLEDIYLSLPAVKQKEFKIEGEKTTKEIDILLNKAKINMGKIVALIRKWLSLIPGINKFFLEQEAKIKADEIVKLKER